jgi:hypothetical protein
MEEKNNQRKRSGTKYITPLTVLGSAIGAGSSYMLTFPIATAYSLATQLQTIGDGRITEGLYQAISTGSEIGGYAALAGGVVGLLATARIRKSIGSLFGRK